MDAWWTCCLLYHSHFGQGIQWVIFLFPPWIVLFFSFGVLLRTDEGYRVIVRTTQRSQLCQKHQYTDLKSKNLITVILISTQSSSNNNKEHIKKFINRDQIDLTQEFQCCFNIFKLIDIMYHKCGLKKRNQMIVIVGRGKAFDNVK